MDGLCVKRFPFSIHYNRNRCINNYTNRRRGIGGANAFARLARKIGHRRGICSRYRFTTVNVFVGTFPTTVPIASLYGTTYFCALDNLFAARVTLSPRGPSESRTATSKSFHSLAHQIHGIAAVVRIRRFNSIVKFNDREIVCCQRLNVCVCV